MPIASTSGRRRELGCAHVPASVASDRRRLPLPHRCGDGDGADLPPGPRAPELRDLPAARVRSGPGRACAPTTSRSSSSRARAGRASSWAAAPGARAPTGAPSSAMTPTRSPRSTAVRWRSSRSCATARRRSSRPVLLEAPIGPRGDAYAPSSLMTADEAERYHSAQMQTLSDTPVDLITALTFTYADEAIGMTRAARAAGLPVAVSFTVETDGRLPSGQTLRAAIEQVDAETDGAPLHYMINCAHPTPLRRRGCRGRAVDGADPRGCARTPRCSATPSSTRPRSSTTAIPQDLAARHLALRDSLPEPLDPRWLLRHRHPPRHAASPTPGWRRRRWTAQARCSQSASKPARCSAKRSATSASGKVENFAITTRAGRCMRIDWPFMPSAA